MMRRNALLGSSLLVTLAVTACQEQVTAPSPSAATPRIGAQLSLETGTLGGAPFDRSLLQLPALGRTSDLLPADFGARAIDPGDYVCSEASPINGWLVGAINNSLAREQSLFLTAVLSLAADQIPMYEAILFETSARPQYFGRSGEHTKTIGKAERDLKRFWDIASSGIQVVGMHGDVLMDTIRTAATYRALGLSSAQSRFYARTLRNTLLRSTTMVGGDHPLFTFNAVAVTTFGGPIPDKIVMGDGILAGYDALGFGDVAPQAIFAHEFAHHVQFQRGYGIAGTPSERTRFSELHADALAAYYLTHSRGATLNRKRVEQFLDVFYQIGDCSFTVEGHHGTPNQRLAAARFGFALADAAHKQGHIMSPDAVTAAFAAEYARIVAPDAP
jgi:hypothetical protein